jgi:hypothetical protein
MVGRVWKFQPEGFECRCRSFFRGDVKGDTDEAAFLHLVLEAGFTLGDGVGRVWPVGYVGHARRILEHVPSD